MTTTSDDRARAIEALSERVLEWYDGHRRDLPWRRTRDPYALVIAEMMLQQTGVERVALRWEGFLERFPTWAALAGAPAAEVIREWEGLGYNRRAVALHRLADIVVGRYGGELPRDRAELLALPGIGPYTADAILSFVHGVDAAAVDVNLQRVIGRVLEGRADLPLADVRAAAALALPAGRSSAWNQALMDFAAIQCTLRRPACLFCPLRELCAFARGALQPPEHRQTPRAAAEAPTPFRATTRFLRGRLVDALRRLGPDETLSLEQARAVVAASLSPDADPLPLLAALERDGLAVAITSGASSCWRLP